MKNIIKSAILVIALSFGIMSCNNEKKEHDVNSADTEQKEHKVHDNNAEAVDHGYEMAMTSYQCPMKCEGEKTYGEEGTCPKCKMDLKEIEVASNEKSTTEE